MNEHLFLEKQKQSLILGIKGFKGYILKLYKLSLSILRTTLNISLKNISFIGQWMVKIIFTFFSKTRHLCQLDLIANDH